MSLHYLVKYFPPFWLTVTNESIFWASLYQDNYHCDVGQLSKNSVNSSASDGECRSTGKMAFLSCVSVIAPSDHFVNARITRRRTRGGFPSRWCCHHTQTSLTPVNNKHNVIIIINLRMYNAHYWWLPTPSSSYILLHFTSS